MRPSQIRKALDDYAARQLPGTPDLWPAVHSLMQWGEKHRSPDGARRVFIHVDCDTAIGPTGVCPACGGAPVAAELEMRPGPGTTPPLRDDAVTLALREPRRLLTPLR